MSNTTQNTALVSLGGTLAGGKVVGIFKTGVMTLKGTYTRFYPLAEAEALLAKKQDTVKA
jgi:hypothetical protein